ncbi:MAG: glycoside hydrolase family 3 C-terminal domain-containing protein [Bacteroidales bacterium]|nr:glycoside hydrolase family 3 C-terminal domain-containing protein [Bacteroidales bacterium]
MKNNAIFLMLTGALLLSFGCRERFAYPFLNTSLPAEERAWDIVSRLTLEEKVAQMQNNAPAIERLGIPSYNWWNECLHGVGRDDIATVFPQAIGMAATWNPDLILKEAEVISTEARAKHHEHVRNNERSIYQGLTFWSPNINIFRDPRWGRGQETYGEDPFLTSRIAVAFVKGLQGDDPRYFKVISTPKHFAVHSGPESSRHRFNAVVDDRDLYETYLPAFEACFKEAGAWSVMCAYNRTQDEACCASPPLLKGILRDKWGFQGYVVSDCGAIWDIYTGHRIVDSAYQASAMAVKAGCDLTCGNEYLSLKKAVEEGLISEETIDQAVQRLMLARIRLGMFDPEEMVHYARIPITENDKPEHTAMAEEIARQSMVLLKNQEGILPLKESSKKIVVVGPFADQQEILLGNYNGTPSHPVTFLEGIKSRTGKDTRVVYCKGFISLPELVTPTDISSRFLHPASPSVEHGLKAEYFNNPDLEGDPVVTTVDTLISPRWRLKAPFKNVPADHFSVRWTGFLVPPFDGTYEIGFSSDYRGRLYLNDEPVIDDWQVDDWWEYNKVTLVLTKDKPVAIRLEYADDTDYAGIGLSWRMVRESGFDKTLYDEMMAELKNADVCIFVGGISPSLEGEEMQVEVNGFSGGDRSHLNLPAIDEEMLKAVHASGVPTVLVLTGGSALSVNWAQDHIPAIIHTWYPGQAGGSALADVLFGNYNPSGKLPVTFYKSVEDLPDFEDYSMNNRTYKNFKGDVLYPFGHGLSYAKFDYLNATIPASAYSQEDTCRLTVEVSNDSDRAGEEVIQVYASKENSQFFRPLKTLVGFQKVMLNARETKKVTIPVQIKQLRYYDTQEGDYRVEPGNYTFLVGSSSEDIRLQVPVEVR